MMRTRPDGDRGPAPLGATRTPGCWESLCSQKAGWLRNPVGQTPRRTGRAAYLQRSRREPSTGIYGCALPGPLFLLFFFFSSLCTHPWVAPWQRSVGLGFPWAGLSPRRFVRSPGGGCLGKCRPFDEEWAIWVRRWPKRRRYPPSISLWDLQPYRGEWPSLGLPIGLALGRVCGCVASGLIKQSPGGCRGGRGEALGSTGDAASPRTGIFQHTHQRGLLLLISRWGWHGETTLQSRLTTSLGLFFKKNITPSVHTISHTVSNGNP